MADGLYFIGHPRTFKKLCSIYPPSIINVVSEENFGYYSKILTISQEEIEDIYNENNSSETPLNPMEYMFNIAFHDWKQLDLIQKAFKFFIHEEVTFLFDQKIIIFGKLDEELKKVSDASQLRILKENDYFEFQNQIREAIGIKSIEPPNPNEDPRIKKMKAKMRLRDRVKAKKSGLTMDTTLASICCMGLGLNPLNVGEISYASIPLLFRYYQEKEKYETDIKSLLAGADANKIKPVFWIRNLENE